MTDALQTVAIAVLVASNALVWRQMGALTKVALKHNEALIALANAMATGFKARLSPAEMLAEAFASHCTQMTQRSEAPEDSKVLNRDSE